MSDERDYPLNAPTIAPQLHEFEIERTHQNETSITIVNATLNKLRRPSDYTGPGRFRRIH